MCKCNILAKVNKSKSFVIGETLLCSFEGRTSRRGLFESCTAYPASLGVRTLIFSSLSYKINKQSPFKILPFKRKRKVQYERGLIIEKIASSDNKRYYIIQFTKEYRVGSSVGKVRDIEGVLSNRSWIQSRN